MRPFANIFNPPRLASVRYPWRVNLHVCATNNLKESILVQMTAFFLTVGGGHVEGW